MLASRTARIDAVASGYTVSVQPHSVEVFPFRFERCYQVAGIPFGITPATTGVRVTPSHLAVRFGPWSLRTPLSNIEAITTTGPFGMLRTAGPAHLSLTDGGLTCATNSKRGLCITFDTPVAGIEPLGLLRHPAVTVTVSDCERLADKLT